MSKIQIAGTSFCFTGGLKKYRRREVNDIVRQHGGTVNNHVCHGTDYLVAAGMSAKSGSAKLRDAKRLGVKVISEREFMAAIA